MSLEDKLAIHEVFGRYALTVDAPDPAAWAALFTKTGIFEIEAGAGGPRLQFEGTAAIESFGSTHARLIPGTRHIQSGHVTVVEGDRATDSCTLAGLVNRPDRMYIFASGWYETWLSKEEGHWKIAHRIAHCDNFEPTQFAEGELAELFGDLNAWVAENASHVIDPSLVES